MIILKLPDEIDKMRVSNQIVAEILSILKERVKPGVTTAELDRALSPRSKDIRDIRFPCASL
jgi:methionine aminopeptidase